jgi:hypothetical protein
LLTAYLLAAAIFTYLNPPSKGAAGSSSTSWFFRDDFVSGHRSFSKTKTRLPKAASERIVVGTPKDSAALVFVEDVLRYHPSLFGYLLYEMKAWYGIDFEAADGPQRRTRN